MLKEFKPMLELFLEDGSLNPKREDIFTCDQCNELTQEIYNDDKLGFICEQCELEKDDN